MIKKILKFLPSAILIAIPSLIALYNNLESKIDCNRDVYRNHPNCILTSNQEIKEITKQKISETREILENEERPELIITNTVAEINHLRQQIYKRDSKDLNEITREELLKQSEKHNQLVLDLLNELSEESKIRVCQRNKSFTAIDSIQIEIKEICDLVLGKESMPSVEGVNSEKIINLFEIELEDVFSPFSE